MGVTGLWDILRPSGKLRSLTHIAVVDGFEANPANFRGLRIGIDASIWFFHAVHGREGENPELRTLFFRCARLTSAPFLPLFIFDGPKRPKVKRGKRISDRKYWLVDSMKEIIKAFGFEWRMAPGEAEAELAHLNSIGVIDAVLSDDVDNFLFGAKMVIRSSSVNLSGNSKHTMTNVDGRVDDNHSTIVTSADILVHPSVQLTRGGLILISLLSGGDYHAGLPRCGPVTAHGLAKCGLGDELLKAAQSLTRDELHNFLITWCGDLRSELRTNSRGHLSSKMPSLAKAARVTHGLPVMGTIPDAFPDIDVLLSYTNPIISATDARACHTHTPPRWECEPDLGRLAHLCESRFEWGLKDIIIKCFRTILWPSFVLRALRRSVLEAAAVAAPGVPGGKERRPLQATPSTFLARHFSSLGPGAHDTGGGDAGGLRGLIVNIHGLRMHTYTDGILEYRLEVAPAQLVYLARAGIQESRKPADTTYDILPSASEDSGGDPDDRDTGTRKRKRGAGAPLEPDSHLRMWMPACTVRPALPDLVKRYEAELEAKRTKKLSKVSSHIFNLVAFRFVWP
ncbi:PIN domain-like protein [Lactarius pseudohatsudake]|nr:PIN domain-like protein [Lactarius pseudohatsudake]